MSPESNKAMIAEFMERAFNQGDLSVIDQQLHNNAVDHQEGPGTPFPDHLKRVIRGLRATFPDLHFEIHDMVAEGDLVAFRSTMTGTHRGISTQGPLPPLPPTGETVSVAHMHFLRIRDGRTTDLWHVWDVAGMMRQLGVASQV